MKPKNAKTKLKHDILQCLPYIFCVNCPVNLDTKSIEIGYIYVDKIRVNELILTSGTGASYKVKIPSEIQGISNSQQFNYKLEII